MPPSAELLSRPVLPWSPQRVLLDVRMASAGASIPGALRIPMYRPIEANSLPQLIRIAAFAFFGVPGTERDPGWLADVQRAVPKNADIVLIDEAGGSLEVKPGTPYGFPCRALKAAFFLKRAGYRRLRCLDGGARGWGRAGLPTVEEAEA